MNYTIVLEVNLFIQAFLIGMALMCAYDVIRALRRLIVHNPLAAGIEDVVYWFSAGIIVFLLLYDHNNGIVRGFVIVSVIIGMLIFEALFGRWIIKIVNLLGKPLQKLHKRYKMKRTKEKQIEKQKKLERQEEKLKEKKLREEKKALKRLQEAEKIQKKLAEDERSSIRKKEKAGDLIEA